MRSVFSYTFPSGRWGVESEFGWRFVFANAVGDERKNHPKAGLLWSFVKFHQGWCNSRSYVNERLQKPRIVLVSDPFTKDSVHPLNWIFVYEVDASFGRPSLTVSRQL